jgi:hypothetical protein
MVWMHDINNDGFSQPSMNIKHCVLLSWCHVSILH